MKYIIFILISVLAASTAFSQNSNNECEWGPQVVCESNLGITDCLLDYCNALPPKPAVGDPYLYEGDCQIAIERYLSRASDVLNLDKLTNPDLPFIEANKQTYCDLLKAMVDLDIQFIQRAYHGGANQEHQLYCGENWFKHGQRIVQDINYIYDCHGKRRPIIQGMVYEFANYDNFDHNLLYSKWIPTWIIEYYFSQFPAELDIMDPISKVTYREYYYIYQESTNEWIPNGTLCFKGDRIMTEGFVNNGEGSDIKFVDITKLEMRMWFLYQAMVQIDMGYTALHMGLYYEYAKNDLGYDKLYNLTNAIRNYAACKNSFVLLSGETPVGESAKWGGSDQFIFDFDSRAMRPREISPPSTLSVSPDGDCIDLSIQGANYPVNAQIVADWIASPCNNIAYPAIIDPCTINSFGGSVSGISPLGCFVEQLPYTVHFDGFSPTTAPVATGGPSSLTYGFNDHQWFYDLPDECKAWWYDYFYCNRRDYHGGHGYVVVPGMIHHGSAQLNPINEEPLLMNMLQSQTLAINEKPLTVKVDLVRCIRSDYECVDICNGVSAPLGKKIVRGKNQYAITVENTDCSSIYSIHIIDPNGNYLPQEIGDTMLFIPPIDGNYTIKVRQDNLALDASTYGTIETTSSIYLQAYCCANLISPDRCRQIYITTSCISIEGAPIRKYEYFVEALDSFTHINNIRPISIGSKSLSNSLVTSHSAFGIIQTLDTSSTVIDFLLDVTIEGDASFGDTFLVSSVLDNCSSSDQRSFNTATSKNTPIKIYPNPTDGEITVVIPSMSTENHVQITIFDILGRLVFVNNSAALFSNAIKLNLSQLESGTYFITIKNDAISENAKLILQK